MESSVEEYGCVKCVLVFVGQFDRWAQRNISVLSATLGSLDDFPVIRVQAVSWRLILNRRPLLMPPTPKGPAAAAGLLIPCLGSVEGETECEVATGVL